MGTHCSEISTGIILYYLCLGNRIRSPCLGVQGPSSPEAMLVQLPPPREKNNWKLWWAPDEPRATLPQSRQTLTGLSPLLCAPPTCLRRGWRWGKGVWEYARLISPVGAAPLARHLVSPTVLLSPGSREGGGDCGRRRRPSRNRSQIPIRGPRLPLQTHIWPSREDIGGWRVTPREAPQVLSMPTQEGGKGGIQGLGHGPNLGEGRSRLGSPGSWPTRRGSGWSAGPGSGGGGGGNSVSADPTRRQEAACGRPSLTERRNIFCTTATSLRARRRRPQQHQHSHQPCRRPAPGSAAGSGLARSSPPSAPGAELIPSARTYTHTLFHGHTRVYTLSHPHTTPGASTLRAAIVHWRGSSQVRYLPPAAAGSEHRRDGPEESDAGARAAARTVMWIYSRFPQEPAETPEVPGSGSARRG
ncbi:TPA: hypothetical protein BOS_25157 [Bos taurus]|nr:TPA: hypothetical protein BOS_25157 [Bos taurus]